MPRKQKILIGVGIAVLAAILVGVNLWFRADSGVSVTTETIKTRDLEAVVSASGKIQPKHTVNISSDTIGRVVNLAVTEGERVKRGQFLLQIDPKTYKSRVDQGTASLRAAEVTLEQMRQAVETARVQLVQARQNLARQQDLWKQQLTTKEALDKSVNDLQAAESGLQEREKSANAQASRINQERAGLESAQYDLSRVRIESPIDGIVTRRSIEEGEMVVVGTMNNAGTVLLTLADMSIIQAEVEVDETNIPQVQIGQIAKISIDAIPDKFFKGHVTEIGNSPIQAATASVGTQATNFKVVAVLDEPVPDVRPGFTCTADITTATRKQVASVPIPAVAVRELIYDANGQVVKPKNDRRRSSFSIGSSSSSSSSGSGVEQVASAMELKPGQTRKEVEGVFVMRNDKAEFVPIKMGIAGDKYFEILSGLQPGDVVITGPYNSVRGIKDGDAVQIDAKQKELEKEQQREQQKEQQQKRGR